MSLTFTYNQAPMDIVFGAGRASSALAEALDRLGVSRALVVASDTQRARTTIVETISGRIAGHFNRVIEHVPSDVAEDARRAAAAANADVVVCIGGGSATGVAKAVALTTGLPIVAIPTTYAGSELTNVWGITTNGVKRTGSDPSVLPRIVVYDPLLYDALPRELTAASAFNALAHALEAHWAPRANPISSALAVEAVRVLIPALQAMAESEVPEEWNDRLLYGSILAGQVFSAAGSGLHHKICHLLGGMYSLPHAQTHAVLITRVFALNAPHAPEARLSVAEAIGDQDAAGELTQLARSVGIPPSLRALGMTVEQLDEATEALISQLPIANPAPLSREAITRLMSSAYNIQ